MPARTPEALHALFSAAFSSRDVDTLMSLYEPDATLVPQPGHPVSGRDAIRESLGHFLALGGTFAMGPTTVTTSDDVALLVSNWTLKGGTGPDGAAVELAGRTSDVARRQPDGTWRLAIDCPFGTAEG